MLNKFLVLMVPNAKLKVLTLSVSRYYYDEVKLVSLSVFDNKGYKLPSGGGVLVAKKGSWGVIKFDSRKTKGLYYVHDTIMTSYSKYGFLQHPYGSTWPI